MILAQLYVCKVSFGVSRLQTKAKEIRLGTSKALFHCHKIKPVLRKSESPAKALRKTPLAADC